MSVSPATYQRLHELVTAQMQGELTAQQAAALEELVLGDEAVRRLYINYVRESARLRWWSEQALPAPLASDVAPPSRKSAPPVVVATETSGVIARWAATVRFVNQPLVFSLLFAAVCLWGGLGLLAVLRTSQLPAELKDVASRGDNPEAHPVAQFTRAIEAQWSASEAPREGGALSAGQELDLAGGLAEIRFADGARVLLQGPSRFRLDSARRGYLTHGRLTAQVPAKSVGFTIDTPRARVIDVGTEFGVEADASGRLEVHVFDGAVQTVVFNPRGVQTHHLTASQSLRVDALSQVVTGFAADAAHFARDFAPNERRGAGEVSAPRQVIRQAADADYLAWEAEHFDRNDTRSPRRLGWLVATAAEPIDSPIGARVPPAKSSVSEGGALVADFELGLEGGDDSTYHAGRVGYVLQFREAGVYHLYLRVSLYDRGPSPGSYANEDSLYVPSRHLTQGFGPPTHEVNNLNDASAWLNGERAGEGRYGWCSMNSELLSDFPPPRYEIAPYLIDMPLTFQLDTREGGLSIDRVVLTLHENLTADALDALKNSPQERGR